MFFLPVTLTSAGAAALLNLWLAIRVIRLRFAEKVLIGDGGSPRLLARMRAQMNFVEYTPIILILIGLIELAQGARFYLWVVATAYLIGRVLHAFGMDGWLLGRQIGTVLTFLTLAGLGLYAAWLGYTGTNPLH
ncbi:MAPEG family protein [Sphingomonas pokkalii]|uniref:GST-like protein n=1 Tax=Sphingomonas pokkalii TaxID=2175090 RepID=A0A2U0S9P1_9SPHN|nr:MAPEG family protein [Sphingomonas pokkalii]PVX28092.1 GST-like protein [Sphingomonas pokkalii]